MKTQIHKVAIILCLALFTSSFASAQKGFYAKFSLGYGLSTDYSVLNNSGSCITKNHAIGWGITDNFAIQIGEFGGLTKMKTGVYKYINLDAFGLGFSYRMPQNIKISMIGAYSMVSLAKKSSEAMGDYGGRGFGINISADKEWFIAKRWGLRVGPQVFWLKTTDTDYQFYNFSVNGSIVFYLTPVK